MRNTLLLLLFCFLLCVPGLYGQDEPQYPGIPPQSKIELPVGDARLRLYGTILLNASLSDSLQLGQDVPLFPPPGGQVILFPDGSTRLAGSIHDFIITARQSILGFQLSGPRQTSALVEIDFFGTRPADSLQPQGRVLNQPRLRKAYFQIQNANGKLKLLAGQDRAIIAPIDPFSLSHVGIPLAAAAGNLWAWLPQVRVEWLHDFHDATAKFQAGILRPIFADPRLGDIPPAGVAVDTQFSGYGERNGQPFYQARFAVSGKQAVIGVGVDYGRERVGANRVLDSWALAMDYELPILSRLILRGEAFVGSNLVPFQGGVIQGLAIFQIPGALPPPIFQKIGAGGGWAELSLNLTSDKKNVFHMGGGTDDPRDRNLLPNSTRGKNSIAWASYFREVGDNVTIGAEWTNFQFRNVLFIGPLNTGTAIGRGNVWNLAFAYEF